VVLDDLDERGVIIHGQHRDRFGFWARFLHTRKNCTGRLGDCQSSLRAGCIWALFLVSSHVMEDYAPTF
jgi:hypothetical protein